MNCQNCNSKIDAATKFCLECGSPISQESRQVDELLVTDVETSQQTEELNQKERVADAKVREKTAVTPSDGTHSFKVTWILATFFGFLGADRFYLGHVGTGVLKLIGFGWYGVWWLLDLIRLNKGGQKDSNDKPLIDQEDFIAKARVISAILIPIVLIVNLFVFVAVIVGLFSASTT